MNENVGMYVWIPGRLRSVHGDVFLNKALVVSTLEVADYVFQLVFQRSLTLLRRNHRIWAHIHTYIQLLETHIQIYTVHTLSNRKTLLPVCEGGMCVGCDVAGCVASSDKIAGEGSMTRTGLNLRISKGDSHFVPCAASCAWQCSQRYGCMKMRSYYSPSHCCR